MEIKDEILDEDCISVRSNAKVHLDIWLTNDEWKTLLQNQEDVKKYQGLVKEYGDFLKRHTDCKKDRQIVKRLEEQLDLYKRVYGGGLMFNELQKILGEKE